MYATESTDNLSFKSQDVIQYIPYQQIQIFKNYSHISN